MYGSRSAWGSRDGVGQIGSPHSDAVDYTVRSLAAFRATCLSIPGAPRLKPVDDMRFVAVPSRASLTSSLR